MTMTYTLAMAADQGIHIADDGTSEVAMTYARAHLTQLIREVRYGKKSAAFTERGERSAYVVPVESFENAKVLQRVAEMLKDRDPDLYEELLADATVEAHIVKGRRRRNPEEDVL
jgi:prevent-host-death family protein